MDPRRFDSFTRSLAAPRSRRGLLRGLVGLGAGLLAARGAADAQAQCANVSCRNNPARCGPGCVCCVWGNGNTRCTAPGNCSGTPTCPPGQVPDPAGGCGAPTTTTTTTTPAPPCSSSDQCPSGQACVNGGCFRPCTGENCPACPGCECHFLDSVGARGAHCIDTGVFIGTCGADADCPSGTVCSPLRDPQDNRLCTQPCCARA